MPHLVPGSNLLRRLFSHPDALRYLIAFGSHYSLLLTEISLIADLKFPVICEPDFAPMAQKGQYSGIFPRLRLSFPENPIFFPVIWGEVAETGSNLADTSTTHKYLMLQRHFDP